MRRYLIHGVLAGLAGGAAFSLVLLFLGEGPIGDAIALEHQRPGAHDHADAIFGRGAQQAGGALGGVVFGVALGAIFAVAFALLRRRLRAADDWRAAVSLAGIGFVTLYLVPFLKYPANPPAVGDPDTIGQRTVLWLLVLAWSAVATWAGWRAAQVLRQRRVPDHLRFPAVVGLYAAIVACGLALLPASPDEVAVPATLLWRFRLASLAGAAACWTVLGVAFGWLQLAAQRREAASPVPGAAALTAQ
jgi:hypothetical protein